jgi:hypothetical protein
MMWWKVAGAALLCTSFACGAGDSGSRPQGGRPVVPGAGGATAGSKGSGSKAGAGGTDTFGNRDPNAAAPRDILAHGDGGVCKNLQCQQRSCIGTTPTTVSGLVLDPAGTNPLYNVVVYVPNAAVGALPQGVTCDACDSLYMGEPVASTLTDGKGHFTLEDVPDGDNIPLVVQIGKWRRQFVLPTVAPCQDNPQPDGMFRLPRNQSEGDLPSIAISTGSADTLECLLRRIGVDASEYVPGAGGNGRVHIFQGSDRGAGGFGGGGGRGVSPNTSPAAPRSPEALWTSLDKLLPYDILLLSCEGQETLGMNQQVLHDYASAGGRVFASHFHYAWFNSGPYANENLATWSPMSNDIGNVNGTIVTTLPDGSPFPKGVALNEWLGTVGALTNGVLPIMEARHNADVSAANKPSQSWIVADQNAQAPNATQYFSFNTPTDALTSPDAKGYCGRVVFSDLHVGAASGDDPTQPVPVECAAGKLSPQEAALEFMLFDLSSCVTPDDVPPAPPPVR